MREPEEATRVVRFGVFEVELRTAELRKQGVRIRLPSQSFQVLEALLLRPGELVTREELKQKLWPSDSFGDFEHGLNAAVNRVREALGDSSDNPRFVETLPRRGYRFIAPVNEDSQSAAAGLLDNVVPITPSEPPQTAPEPPPPKPRISMLAAVIAVLACMIAAFAALLITWWRIPAPVPVVESITQLTDDRESKTHTMVSDGSRIYFNEGERGRLSLSQVSAAGGPTAPVETRLANNSYLTGIANDGSALIVFRPESSSGGSLWSIPLPTGEPRCLISGGVQNATNLPDGRIVFATLVEGKDPKGTDSRTDWFIAGSDGSNPHKLVSLPGYAGGADASRDGRRILLSQGIIGDNRLFEVAVDGTGLREIGKVSDDDCCFAWTSDEKYVTYESGHRLQHGVHSDIWALPLKAGLFRRTGKPIRLTNGPLPYSFPYPSRDGKRIFVVGTKRRGELVRYDMKSHEFVPFLSGISATDPTFSQDGKWVAYVSYPDGNLWRSRSDGTERIQLTFPPITANFPSISPDGTKVVFHTFHTENGEVFVVSMEGGSPKRIDDNAAYASWSPDGNHIFYGGYSVGSPGPLRITDARSGKKAVVPFSEAKSSGFWLSQDILVVRNEGGTNFETFNLKTQKWTDLALGALGDVENWMISPDRNYLYYTLAGAEPKVMRLRVADHQIETITSLKDLHRAVNYGNTQINVAPDGSPIFTRDTGYDEIYALNVRWP